MKFEFLILFIYMITFVIGLKTTCGNFTNILQAAFALADPKSA